MEIMKKCSKCGIEKDIGEFYANKKTKDGLCCYCKNCDKIRKEVIKDNNKKKYLENNITIISKICPKCGIEKKVDMFNIRKLRKDGLSCLCKSCYNALEESIEYHKEYYKNNITIYKYNGIKYKKSLAKKNIENGILIKEKICSGCKIQKNVGEFHKDISSKDGIYRYCKDCKKKRNKIICNKNKEKNIENGILIKEKECFCCKKIKNVNEFYKQLERKDGLSISCKKCTIEQTSKQKTKRRKNDPIFNLRCCISSQILKSLKSQGSSKFGRSIDNYLPYTIQNLKDHLESQFDENMTWDNHGSYWHVDHIYPQSLLPYDSMDHPNFLKCWSLKNLQPLKASENLKKRNKLIYFYTEPIVYKDKDDDNNAK